MRKVGHLIIGLLIAGLFVMGWPTPYVVAQSVPSTLTIGEVGSPPPTFSGTEAYGPGFNIGSGDTYIPYLAFYPIGLDGGLHPEVVNVPVAVPNTNDTEWIVNLVSPNMVWNDGVPINSTDLAYSWEIFLPTGPYANMSLDLAWGAISSTVKSVSVLNSTAIMVTTYNPSPVFSYVTPYYQVLPWHYYKQFTGKGVLDTTPIFSGPCDTAYCPMNYTAGSTTMHLMANPSSPSWAGKTPTIQSITVQLFTTDSALVSSLAAGTIDAASVLRSDVSVLSPVSNLKALQVGSSNAFYFFLRSAGYPWNDTRFRQSLMYLVNRNEIDSELYNGTYAQGNPIWCTPAGVPKFWPGPDTPVYNYSTTVAAQLLTSVGLSKNSAGSWTYPNGTALSFTFETESDNPDAVRIAQIITQDMVNFGIQVTDRLVPFSTVTIDFRLDPTPWQIFMWFTAFSPTPFRYMRNNLLFVYWVDPTRQQFNTMRKLALSDTDPARALQEMKQAELIMANAAVSQTILYVPYVIVYNNASFTNWTPALYQSTFDYVFSYPPLSENVLTSVQPVSVSTTSSSTMTTTPTPTNYGPIASAIVVVIVIVLGVIAYARRRKTTKQ